MHTVPASTERLAFRWWSADDLPLASAIWGDPRVTRLVDARPRMPDEEIHDRFALEIARGKEHGIQYWPFFLRPGSEHVGCCGLKPHTDMPHVVEVGFYLLPPFWNLGLALEAARSAVAFGFDIVHAELIAAGHHPENHGSRRTLENLGFVYLQDELFAPTGRLHPTYRLTRAQFERAGDR